MSVPVLAVDIGGTKIAAALVGADGAVGFRAQTPTQEPTGAAQAIADRLVALVRDVASRASSPLWAPDVVAVACAGPLDVPAGTATPVNILSWRAFPVVDLLRQTFPAARVVLVGDAIAVAAGEHWLGAGRGTRSMLGIVVSTGIGGGLVLDGRVYPGPTGNAGHFGHINVDPSPDAAPCNCDARARGCVEALASGPALLRWANKNGWDGADVPALAEAARHGEPVAVAAFDRGALALARGIAATAAVVDLDAVVVGGGVSQAGDVLFAPLRRGLAEVTTLGFARRVEIRTATLGQDAGLVGAARLGLSLPVIGRESDGEPAGEAGRQAPR